MSTLVIDAKKVKAVVKTGKNKGRTIYESQVIDVNKALKDVNKSFSGCVKMLLSNCKEIGLDAQRIEILRAVQKDTQIYKSFKALVRTSKYKGKDLGTYSPYYVLQTLNTNITSMTKQDAIDAKKATVTKKVTVAKKATVTKK